MSIFWSYQKISNWISEIDLADPFQHLSEQEKTIYQKLKFPKRQAEWLGARLVIKDLVRAVDIRYETRKTKALELLNEESGAPYLKATGVQESTGRVSLSHSNGHVLCAYSPEVIPLGVDLELVEPRGNEFVEDYFTESEILQADKLDGPERQLHETMIWSCKESVLKALSSGLRVDTRLVEVYLPKIDFQLNGWTTLGLKSSLLNTESLSLVWRREGNFVLTACIPCGNEKELNRINL
jgi:4'-phosphopantetheinyl transferase